MKKPKANRFIRFDPPGWIEDLAAGENTGMESAVTPIAPRFGRDGQYIDRIAGECWIEYNGRAWSFPRGLVQARWELRHVLGYFRPLTAKEAAAVKLLTREGFSGNTTLAQLLERMGPGCDLEYGGVKTLNLRGRRAGF